MTVEKVDASTKTQADTTIIEGQTRKSEGGQNANVVPVVLAFLKHRVDVLKEKTSLVHELHNSLQDASRVASEAVAFLRPMFNVWSGRTRVMDRLNTAMLYNDEFPPKISETTKMVIEVNASYAFFNGKDMLIRNKLLLFGKECNALIPPIYDSNNDLKAQFVWEEEFDAIWKTNNINEHLDKEIDVGYFNDSIDKLFKVEVDMTKFITDANMIVDARWTEAVARLEQEKAFNWPTDREVNRWEAMLKSVWADNRVGLFTSVICQREKEPTHPISYKLQHELFIAAEGIFTGQLIYYGRKANVSVGNVLALRSIPEGSVVSNVEQHVGDHDSFARASGDYAIVISHYPDNDTSRIKLPSRAKKIAPSSCRAMIGQIAGGGRIEKLMLKYGIAYYKYRVKRNCWTKVHGVAMNPVEHPHGGGNHRHMWHAFTVCRDAPPRQKVGLIAARTGCLCGQAATTAAKTENA